MSGGSEHAETACEEFQGLLPILLQDGESLYRHPHLKTCAICRSLVVDLEKIADDAGRPFGPED